MKFIIHSNLKILFLRLWAILHVKQTDDYQNNVDDHCQEEFDIFQYLADNCTETRDEYICANKLIFYQVISKIMKEYPSIAQYDYSFNSGTQLSPQILGKLLITKQQIKEVKEIKKIKENKSPLKRKIILRSKNE